MCGSDISLDVVLLKFRESWARPLHVCGLPGPLVLPASATTALLLRDVAALTRRQQQTLLDWIDAAVAKAQIISATSQDLFAAVVSRSFSERLYYRLNVLVAEL
jgi:hypothetical protein